MTEGVFAEVDGLTLYQGDSRAALRELPTTLAYLAGIVDGEGYVGVKKARRRDAWNPCYHERIQVRMVHPEALRMLTVVFGGTYHRQRRAQVKGRRRLYCWQVSDAQAARALEVLLPYLVVKRAAATNVLLLRESKRDPRARLRGGPRGRPMPADIVEERERIYLAAKALNGRGGGT